MTEVHDIAIIGGGPVGIFAGFYSGLRKTKTIIFEALPQLGGQVASLYPNKDILDIAGFKRIKGNQLINDLIEQLHQFDTIEVKLQSKIVDIKKVDEGFELTTSSEKYLAKTIVLATGKGDFHPRKLQIPDVDLESLEEKYIKYFYDNPEQMVNKTVMVIGGGDQAIESVIEIGQSARETHLMHRSTRLRALEATVDELNASNVIQHLDKKIEKVSEDKDKLSVQFSDNQTGEREEVLLDELQVKYGLISDNQQINQWSVKIDNDQFGIKVDDFQQTSVEGIYAIGDASFSQNQAELIATGFGQGPLAINAAVRLFDPDRGGPTHSTAQQIVDGQAK